MRFLLIAGLLAGLAGEAAAWGGRGHRLIASLAEKRLRARHPEVMQRIAALLGPDVTLASIASCADSIRDYVSARNKSRLNFPAGCIVTEQQAKALFPATGSWHYINIPVPASANPSAHPNTILESACASGAPCITGQIEHFREQLKNRKLDTRTRAIALMFLVHLVGDLHQPLHAVARNADRGGNEVFVKVGAHTGRLHSLWDTFLVDGLEEADVESEKAKGGKNPKQWAWESYDAAVRNVYSGIPVKTSTFEKPIVLPDPAYRDAGATVVKQRLRAASIRLAEVLAKALAG